MGSNCILAAEGLFKASWSALEDLLEPKRVVKRAPKEGEPDRGELGGTSSSGRGGAGEGFTPLPL